MRGEGGAAAAAKDSFCRGFCDSLRAAARTYRRECVRYSEEMHAVFFPQRAVSGSFEMAHVQRSHC